MTDYRIEVDSLGEVKVPRAALYAAQTQRARENFPISGLKPWPAFIWSMALIKRAAAEVNMELGLLDARLATAIMQAGDEILSGQHHAHFVVDPFQAGAGTSHNMNTNEVMANRANQILGYAVEAPDKLVHANDHVNMAQSTNDTIPTAIRLGALWRLEELLTVLRRFVEVTRGKAADWDDVVKTGRTHLQDAVPVRLGQEVGAWATAIERQIDKLQFAAGRSAALGHRRHRGWHGLERAPGLSPAHGRQAVRADGHSASGKR